MKSPVTVSAVAVTPWPFGAAAAVLLALLIVGTPLNLPQIEDVVEITLLIAAGFLLGVFLIWKGLNDLQLLRLVKDTPTSEIGSMASGDVEIKGEAKEFEDSYEAPFSGSECLAFEYKVEEYRETKRSAYWETVEQGRTNTPFALDDGTGVAAVDFQDADLKIEWRTVSELEEDEKPGKRAEKFLQNNQSFVNMEVNDEGWDQILVDNRRRYMERTIKPGDQLYIFGEAASFTDSGIKRIRKGDAPVFVISEKGEKQLIDSFSTWYKILLPAGFLLALGCYGLLYLLLL